MPVTWRTSGRLAVLLAAVALVCVQAPLLVTGHDVAWGLAIGLALAHGAAAPIALGRPLSGAALALLAAAAQMLVTMQDASGQWPWAVAPLLTQLLVLVVLAMVDDRPVAVGCLGASVLLGVVLALVGLPWRHGPDSLANVVLFASLGVVAVALGVGGSRLTAIADALRQERVISAEEQARRLVVEEKARVARELHDVIAHNMSLITVQARSAAHRMPGLPTAAAAEFEEIAVRAAEALSQMRGVLTVLRTEPGQSGRRPVPGLDQVPELLASVREAGEEIRDDWSLPARTVVDEEVGASAYRIVQEALSNARRHAVGHPAEVKARLEGGGLALTVTNTLDGPLGTAAPGHGLVGMRERAAAVGGRVRTGELEPGSFVVSAWLPLHRPPGGEA
ncbi:histidine kinase [Nocardioides sp. W7]|uniref:sensor histidine kinase n=1 Tax=Nocardioides sp. W7 TaxID=2931390 RepID=UPI001FCFCB0D|nr:histidine kinase [Nocardioides sp. W7]